LPSGREIRRIQHQKAKAILKLIENAEKGDAKALEQAKAKREEICRVESWET
jgi:hypothetical protein